MLSVLHLSRCTHSLRSAPGRLLVSNTNLHGRLASRQLITPVRCYKSIGVARGYKLGSLIKSNGITARFCSSSPQPRTSKVVGYWLLGCSGMVFTAVVLGTVGYLVLVYCVYYVIDVVVSTTNGRK